MNSSVKMFLNLTITGAVSGAILAGVFHFADPLIQANKEKELKEAIFVVLPEAKDFKLLEKTVGGELITVYKGVDAIGNPVGIAFKADGGGFQGNIGIMVGLNLDYLKLKGIKILDQVETPGLGNRIGEPEFEGQFKGVEISPKVEYIKNRKPEKPNQIKAITGATISSDAVVKNINNAVKKVLASFPKEEVLEGAGAAEEKAPRAGEKKDGGK
ncbi:MAG: RnfABCDGE type electron transport complex subunit G [Deltaproteobacteria bacterium]|nr:RnfABCDGE type electron transport complex subunit G [Deltaproteobacteria bacterium]